MKKLMLLLAVAGFSSLAIAQETSYEWTKEEIPTKKHQVVMNRFWDNWFIDAGVDHLSFYSDEEHAVEHGKKNPFWPGRRSWGADLSIGKWVTPGFGLRVKGQAAWGTKVQYQDYSAHNPSYRQFSLSLQPMLNLTNLIGGYKPRWWEISLYGGFGMTDQTWIEDGAKGGDNNCSMIADLGVLNTWTPNILNRRLHFNLDLYVRAGEDQTDGVVGVHSGHRIFQTRDLNFGVSAGIGVNLGKVGWDNAPDVDAIIANHNAQVAALNGNIADLEAENADLKNKLKEAQNKPAEKVVETVTEFSSTNASVFFNINKSTIASKKDLVNVKELADYAKDNNKKVVVTGYADAKTGSAAYNQKLSEARANAVADELVKMGVSRDNIEVVGQGGVSDLTPYTYNRRAVVSLK